MKHLKYDKAFASRYEVITIGKLHVPSGRIVACDPYFCASAVPFSRQVSAGDYDVQLCKVDSREWGQRVALARILFTSSKKAVSFENALQEFTHSGGYFVDSGVGSFMDELTREAFAEVLAEYYRSHPNGNYYTDILAAEFKRSAHNSQDPDDTGRWNVHYLPTSKLNVAMFASGLGDGSFESFWGLDAGGNITSLVTDFGIL